MKRINITITPHQHDLLKAVSKTTGICVSDLIRRMIDERYGSDQLKPKKKPKRP